MRLWLIFLSLLPLFSITAIISLVRFFEMDDHNTSCPWWNDANFLNLIVSVICVSAGLLGMTVFSLKRSRGRKVDVGVWVVENLDVESIDFYLTVIIPMVALGVLDGWSSLLCFWLTIGLLILLMWRTSHWYRNPVLTALGYHLYRALVGKHYMEAWLVARSPMHGYVLAYLTRLDGRHFYVVDFLATTDKEKN